MSLPADLEATSEGGEGGRMTKTNYPEGELVTVHSLGSSYTDKEYRAKIRGVATEGIVTIYIVEMVDAVDSTIYPYSHCTFPESCLRLGWTK